MSAALFSPGPWDAANTFSTHNHPTRYWETSVESHSGIVAKACGYYDSESKANAKLIAAAPDLYAALKLWIESDFLRSFDSTLCVGCGKPKDGQCDADCSMQIGRLAIAKAEGRNA